MLEIRRGTAAKNYENTFFREFAENLEKFFDKYSIDGLLIANSECEAEKRLQIDALLITNNVVCIIDFKNFGSKIKLPRNAKSEFEFGKWTNDSGEIIKGGNSINPFIQLKNQKERFINVCKNKIIPNFQGGEKFNPFHTVRMVCFQKPIELVGSIPSHEELNFFIIDQNNYLEKIKDVIDIADKEVKLSQNSFDLFKEIFRADKFDIKETYSEKITFDSYSEELNYDNLYPDQKSALQEITEFIKSESEKIFVLQGTSLSGKSHLIPFIEDIAYNNEIAQIELFASSSRVATNLLSESNLKFNSLYSYIYGGGLQETQSDDEANVNQVEENTDKVKLEIVPLKKSDNEDKAIFIVDEAQLVSDNYHQSIDLRFGSGKLLEDFIKFTDLKNSNRKIIFIGDSFQLTIGKKEESTLNPEYLKEKYELETKAFQLIDKEDKSLIVKQALLAVNGIRNQSFNQLSFEFLENLKSLNKEEILPILENRIENNSDFHLLSYSNADAQKVNYWIKRAIIKNGDDIAPDDLIIFNNNFRVEDANDPFAEPKKVFNGQLGTVTKVDSEITPEIITLKGKQSITLKYREVSLILKDTGHNATVLSLENYRLSEKGELSEDEIIALKIILNREIKIELDKNPFEKSEALNEIQQSKEYKELEQEIKLLQEKLSNGEKVKTKLVETERKQRKIVNSAKRKHRKIFETKLNKDTSSKYYKYKNAAQLRFGWALTVHKSMSYKWDEILFNVDQGENRGKTNEDYFKWIYTGLTRAKEKVSIINYKDINPFLKMELRDANTDKKPDKKIYFIANPESKISEGELSLIKKFNFPEEKPQLLQLFQLLNSKLEPNKINISSINHPNYQELYELSGSNGEVATVSFYYNNKGQIKNPTLMKSEPKEFGDEVINILLGKNNLSDFAFIKDKWRENIYTRINQQLNKHDTYFNYIIQVPFKDTVKIIRNNTELIVDMYYDGDGFYSSIIATYYSDDEIWNNFKEILSN
jgi:hypothetical protein